MKENYAIQKLADGTPIPYELLLLADETKEAINKYIFDCTIFTLINEKSNDLVGVMANRLCRWWKPTYARAASAPA